jgi:hypothetical protein
MDPRGINPYGQGKARPAPETQNISALQFDEAKETLESK